MIALQIEHIRLRQPSKLVSKMKLTDTALETLS
jgi:hypothetical protein